jgi:2,3-bisphosphoglycerate-independent phosphoglycerate mutase
MSGRRPVVLCILDGWGLRRRAEANAVALARTPNFDRIWAQCPHAQPGRPRPRRRPARGADGQFRGRPHEHGRRAASSGWTCRGSTGRSRKGTFEAAPALVDLIKRRSSGTGGRAHVAGLASPGGVHAHDRHMVRRGRSADRVGAMPVVLHAFTDGRDVAPRLGARRRSPTMDRAPAARASRIGDRDRAGSTPWTGTSAGSGSRRRSGRLPTRRGGTLRDRRRRHRRGL